MHHAVIPSAAHDPPEDEVAAALDALVAGGPLTVAFQPIVDLEHGEPVGYEVLGRCGEVPGPLAPFVSSPAPLLALAHRHGRLLALDRRWREIAVSLIARLVVEDGPLRAPASGEPGGLFFLNVDPRVVEDPAFAPGFTQALVQRHGLSPDRFVLELTEVPTRDPAAMESVLDHYARQGFRVALDDLGAGQQSLVTLLRIQPQIVKLDRELVRDVDKDASRAHLLRALAEFARRAGIALVAEGIETEAELRVVCDAGVTCGQDYLLGRPASLPAPLTPEVRRTLRGESRRLRPPGLRVTTDPSVPLAWLIEGLRAARSLEEMLQAVTDGAAALLGTPRVSLRLLDEGRERLLVAARTGAPLHAGPRGSPDFAVGEGCAGWVAAHRTPLRLDDAEADARFVAKPGMTAPIRSFLGVPLLDGRGCIGVLATTSPLPHAFTMVDERWMRVVAGVAAPHLEVARLERLAATGPPTLAHT